MYDFHSIDIACGQLVQCDHIFGVMIFNFQQIGNLTVSLLRQIAAHLHTDTLVAPHSHKVDLFCLVLAYYTS